MNQSKRYVIVGGGLVGCLWAVMLAKRGFSVDVYERRGDMRAVGYVGGRSINLAMSERGWHALRQAGIADQLVEVALPMPGRMIHDTEGRLNFQPYGTAGQAIYSVSRGGLNRALLDIADQFDNVRFYFDMRCDHVDLENSKLIFTNTLTSTQHTVKADYVFGIDGAFSAVRGAIQKTDRFNYSQTYLEYGYKELHIPSTPDGQFAMDPNALHIWPRGNFMLIALPNTDKSFTCTLFLPYTGGPDSFESLTTFDAWYAFLDRHFHDALLHMPYVRHEYTINPVSSLVTIRCSPWLYGNNIILMGDAAHAIVPFYGQGMNAGFEDCVILDQLYDTYNGNWSAAFEAFSRTRVTDANAIADLALRNFIEMRDLVADPAFQLRQKITAHFHEMEPERFLPLYTQVSFTRRPYHKALADGLAQDKLFERILALPDIMDNWKHNPEVNRIFYDWLEQQEMPEPAI